MEIPAMLEALYFLIFGFAAGYIIASDRSASDKKEMNKKYQRVVDAYNDLYRESLRGRR